MEFEAGFSDRGRLPFSLTLEAIVAVKLSPRGRLAGPCEFGGESSEPAPKACEAGLRGVEGRASSGNISSSSAAMSGEECMVESWSRSGVSRRIRFVMRAVVAEKVQSRLPDMLTVLSVRMGP